VTLVDVTLLNRSGTELCLGTVPFGNYVFQIMSLFNQPEPFFGDEVALVPFVGSAGTAAGLPSTKADRRRSLIFARP